MAFPRVSTHWSSRVFRRFGRNIRSTNRTRSWQLGQRRNYASDGAHENPKKSGFLGFPAGDIPWAIGSLVVTVPSLWYLAQPQIERYKGKKGGHGDHGDHGHGNSEEDEHEEGSSSGDDGDSAGGASSDEDTTSDDASSDGQEAESEDAPSEGKEGEDPADDATEAEEQTSSENPGGEGANKSGPDTPRDKGSDDVAHETDSGKAIEGVQFKGATSKGPEGGGQDDTRKHIPDAKGGSKKRIESHYGQKLGEPHQPEQDASDKDMASTAKPAGNLNTQSGKQEGLSNTDTKHSTDIVNDPNKSKKGSGAPETAKEKGTVDPKAPLR